MSTITKIEEQKNKARVNIFIDDAFFCGLNKEIAIIFGLKEGQTIDEDKLQEAIKSSEAKSAFEKGVEYFSRRQHTRKELIDKLKKKQYSEEAIKKSIEKMEEYHYIDDEMFAKNFVNQNKNLSNRIIQAKLMQKGVSKQIIDEYVNLRPEDTEIDACKAQAEKYVRSKKIETYEGYQKLMASLARKGFDFDIIKKVCKKYYKNADELDIDWQLLNNHDF